MKNFILLFFFIVLMGLSVHAQAPISNLYQYNYTSISPAFSGLDGQKITMMGIIWRPKAMRGYRRALLGTRSMRIR